jgi:hypothetical protein
MPLARGVPWEGKRTTENRRKPLYPALSLTMRDISKPLRKKDRQVVSRATFRLRDAILILGTRKGRIFSPPGAPKPHSFVMYLRRREQTEEEIISGRNVFGELLFRLTIQWVYVPSMDYVVNNVRLPVYSSPHSAPKPHSFVMYLRGGK